MLTNGNAQNTMNHSTASPNIKIAKCIANAMTNLRIKRYTLTE